MKLGKRTKIVCTIGPASDKPKILEEMIKAGMNVARLNFSHGSHPYHKKLSQTIRAAAKKVGEPVAIIADLQGPKIRIGELPEKGIDLVPGNKIILSTGATKYKEGIVLKRAGNMLYYVDSKTHKKDSINYADIRTIKESQSIYDFEGYPIPKADIKKEKGMKKTFTYGAGGLILGTAVGTAVGISLEISSRAI